MKASIRKPLLVAAMACTVALSSVLPALAYHEGEFQDVHLPAHEMFDKTHNRTDQPVIDGVKRTWLWGPEAYTEGMLEPYADAPGGMRLVQYWDKSRMEINNPGGDQDELWYVTNGLLVIDMVEGRYQIGDATFDYSPDPANVQIAGDPDGDSQISYARIAELGLRNIPARMPGTVISQTIVDDEFVSFNGYAAYNVEAAERVQVHGIDHTIAAPFWAFMNSEGIIYENNQAKTGPLFENPFYGTGYPITEAYWATIDVDGEESDVLWQCFERRCLTYTPGNEAGWKVEAGNVGQHYFQWRYGATGPATESVELGLVALGDDGVMGPAFGCDDSLVTVTDEMQVLATTENQIRAALQRLFVRDPGALYNVFFQKNLIVEQVTIADGTATLYLIGEFAPGGVCDDPRIQEQLHATATQFAGVDDIVIYLNGDLWEMGQMGE
jgi:hypothetical protein